MWSSGLVGTCFCFRSRMSHSFISCQIFHDTESVERKNENGRSSIHECQKPLKEIGKSRVCQNVRTPNRVYNLGWVIMDHEEFFFFAFGLSLTCKGFWN
jgi:hypothetical protein